MYLSNSLSNPLYALLATSLALLVTPFLLRLAWRYNWVDRPTQRKNHAKATAYLGGASPFIIFLLSLILMLQQDILSFALLPAICGIVLLFIVGVVDDKYPINAKIKLLYQCIAVSLILLSTQSNSILFYTIAFPIGILFINAFNLIDGRDGQALGIAAFHCLPITYMAMQSGVQWIQFLALTMTFAFVGLLPFNIHPAKIFLGDGGSLSIGAILFFLYSQLAVAPQTTQEYIFWIPLLLTLPVIDTLAVILYRMYKKLPVMKADHNHIHHLISSWGFGHSTVVSIIHSLSLVGILIWVGLLYLKISLLYFSLTLIIWLLFYSIIHSKKRI